MIRDPFEIGEAGQLCSPEKFLFRSLTYFKYFDVNFDVSSGRIFVAIF